MVHSVRRRACGIRPPRHFAPAQVAAGFCTYERHCVACHGAPGIARQGWANGMNPDPPYLIDAPLRWRRAELFWIVRNGIKLTGMPAWKGTLSDRQTWDLVAFLAAVPRLPPQTYRRWRQSGRCTPVQPAMSSIAFHSSSRTGETERRD